MFFVFPFTSIQHVKKSVETRVELAKAQLEELNAFEDFQQVATLFQWIIHLTLKPKIKIWSTKNKNYRTVLKRVEYDLPPKFISKTDLTFRLDESSLSQKEAQSIYSQMRQLTKEFRTHAMTLYVQSTTREYELLSNEINQIIRSYSRLNRTNTQTTSSQQQQQQYTLTFPDEIIASSQPKIVHTSKRKNYGRLAKRLTHKFRLANIVLRKTHKSKVFHLGRVEDYQKSSEEYMNQTQAYQCLGTNDPLPDLIRHTNKYSLDLRVAKWITQKQYKQLSIKHDEVELVPLYYLLKAHKPGIPLRPIHSQNIEVYR